MSVRGKSQFRSATFKAQSELALATGHLTRLGITLLGPRGSLSIAPICRCDPRAKPFDDSRKNKTICDALRNQDSMVKEEIRKLMLFLRRSDHRSQYIAHRKICAERDGYRYNHMNCYCSHAPPSFPHHRPDITLQLRKR